jgi:GT2 family glycosyltransferase/glycosyltransferase involved in cell wall biosynthesis
MKQDAASPSPVSAIQRGSAYFQNDCFIQAIAEYEQALEEHPALQDQIRFCIAFCKSKIQNQDVSTDSFLFHELEAPKDAPDFCPPSHYKNWKQDKRSAMQRQMQVNLIADHALFSIVINWQESCQYESLVETITSISDQAYGNIEVILQVKPSLVEHAKRIGIDFNEVYALKRGLFIEVIDQDQTSISSLKRTIRDLRGSYIMFLNPGSKLDILTFSIVNFHLHQSSHAGHAKIILIDYEEVETITGDLSPYFYGGWDSDFIASYGVQPDTLAFSKELLIEAPLNEAKCIQDILLGATRCLKPGDPSVLHVPELLLQVQDTKKIAIMNNQAMPEPLEPLSIIIPNKDAPLLLEKCLEFALRNGESFEHEVIIVDNGSLTEETNTLYKSLNHYSWIKILQGPSSFNYSVLVNRGAREAKNPVLLLLNNDVEIDSLSTLLQARKALQREEVGAVGVTLMYPDKSVQHAGISLTSDIKAAHILRYAQKPYRPTVSRYLKHPRNVQAVTGACMLVKKLDYLRVGGHNEIDLPVEFNDIDFCLKIRESGLRVLYMPADGITHHESFSRGKEITSAIISMRHQATSYMRRYWAKQFERDPFQSPNLDINECPIPFLKAPNQNTRYRHRHEESLTYENQRKQSTAQVSEKDIKDIVFDSNWYLDTYSDVKEAGIDAYQHYMSAGWKEGRLPAEDFLIYQYKKTYQEPNSDEKNIILDIYDRISNGDLRLEHVRSFRGNTRNNEPFSGYLEDSVAVYGYLTSEIGLGQAARTLCRSLDELRVPSSFHAYSIPGRENDDEYKSKLSTTNRSRISVAMLPLTEAKILERNIYPGRLNILYGVWELLLPPSDSLPIIRLYDEIWVPSTFVQQSLLTAGIISTVIPHAIPICDRAQLVLDRNRKESLNMTVLVFLDFDSFFSRKNPLAAIEAFKLAFKDNSSVELIVKVRGAGSSQDRLRLSALIESQNQITLLDQTLTREGMDALIANCDCFLSLHRSEGSGFGCAEALALGKIVIATDFGGTTDFITTDTGYPVDYDLRPVHDGEYTLYEQGQTWAEPSVEHAAKLLSQVYTHREEAHLRANYGRVFMIENFSTKAVAAKIGQWFASKGLLLSGYQSMS